MVNYEIKQVAKEVLLLTIEDSNLVMVFVDLVQQIYAN